MAATAPQTTFKHLSSTITTLIVTPKTLPGVRIMTISLFHSLRLALFHGPFLSNGGQLDR